MDTRHFAQYLSGKIQYILIHNHRLYSILKNTAHISAISLSYSYLGHSDLLTKDISLNHIAADLPHSMFDSEQFENGKKIYIVINSGNFIFKFV